MSIGTYQELQVAVTNWLTNPAQVSRVPELIALFEGKVKRSLRVRQMESRSTASTTASQAELALPTDYLEMRNLRINTDPIATLQFLPPHQQDTWHPSQTSGTPTTYKIVGSEIIFAPKPDAVLTVEIDYYSFTPLSDSEPTNWLLTGYPDAYLFGSLSYFNGLGDPDPRMSGWKGQLEEAMTELRVADRGARFNGAPLMARPDFVTP